MNQHYSEADLLETYYLQPGQSMPIMMHLAECADCAARYERLEKKLRGLAACEHEKPDTFWARQRLAIQRRVASPAPSLARTSRVAAAAVLTLVLGGYAAWRIQPPAATTETAPATVAAAATQTDYSSSEDPWHSEPLDDYQSMVAWESWVESDKKKNTGDQPL